LFSESVKDYTPLAKIQLEDLQIWQMKVPADLKQLSGVVSLKKLKLWNLKSTGFEGLASLVNLEELILEMMNASRANAADMAFAKSLTNLKTLELKDSEVSNFDALANCVKLEKVAIDNKTKGIADLEALKKLPNLTSLQVPKDTFKGQLSGFANPKIKVTER